jgi:photosystem II stability/assembly factor-like uncharacterized protein/subtilisin-like proprotein convertase family protein
LIDLKDCDEAWISGMQGLIISTADGGATWQSHASGTTNQLFSIDIVANGDYRACGYTGTLLRSSDGGTTWVKCHPVLPNNPYLRSVQFIDELTGWAVGTSGFILKSTDGGVTWDYTLTSQQELLQSVFFIDPLNGWASGVDGTVVRTIDGGETWFSQYTGVERNYLTAVCFVNTMKGWVVGEGGTILRTDNGGFGHEPGVFVRRKVNLPVADYNEVRDTLDVDIFGMRQSGYRLTGLEVLIDSILHTRAGDLTICLTHDNVTDTLVREVPGTGANFLWTRLKDDAGTLIQEGTAPFSGDHRPYSLLNAFNGLDPDGEWILSVYDGQAGHTGTLHEWGIKPLYEQILSDDEPPGNIPPPGISLSQNLPNPFSGTTRIGWTSETDGRTSLKVYSISGQELETLVDRYFPAGGYCVEFDGARYSPGVYYYRLQVGDAVLTRKCIIL